MPSPGSGNFVSLPWLAKAAKDRLELTFDECLRRSCHVLSLPWLAKDRLLELTFDECLRRSCHFLSLPWLTKDRSELTFDECLRRSLDIAANVCEYLKQFRNPELGE